MNPRAREIVQQLQQAGFIAYFAGGCVRDQLLGSEAKDYDVATSAKPEEVQKGYAPQLPLEGAIAAAGGFKDVAAGEVTATKTATTISDAVNALNPKAPRKVPARPGR